MRRGCLCVFAKPPRPGTVKTRLASALGEDSAAALARAFLLDTWSTATRVPGMDVVLAATEVEAPEWHPLHAAEVWPQGAGTLGDRLERVLRRALQTYPFAIAIGTDIPGLPLSRLDDAREALHTADAVIGPADDGGFYLIGVSACPHGLLDSVPWSAPDTCACTLDRLAQHHLNTTVIDSWFDVDEPADLEALRCRIRDGIVRAPETARILGEAANASLPRAGV